MLLGYKPAQAEGFIDADTLGVGSPPDAVRNYAIKAAILAL